MLMSVNKEELKIQLAKLQGDKSSFSSPHHAKLLRDLRYYQSELRQNKVLIPFSFPLSNLVEGEEAHKVGIHGHTRREYTLHWEPFQQSYIFQLENTKAAKKKSLLECPEEILQDVMPLIPLFIQQMMNQAEKMLSLAIAEGKIESVEANNEDEIEPDDMLEEIDK